MIIGFHSSTVSELSEIREKRYRTPKTVQRLIALISLFSLFADLQDPADAVAQNHVFRGQCRACFCLPYSVTISESQPTVRGHTLTRCPLPGWWVAAAPSTPKRPMP